jgi:Leucine-rich repeat (LRR) protein
MCRVYQIIFVTGAFFAGNFSVSSLYCENGPNRKVRLGIRILNIENCSNTEINLGDENDRAALVNIQAMNNQISRISDDTFKLARELFHIDLRENKIERVSVGAFGDQEKLQILYLKRNKLTRIEVGTFDSLTKLVQLWLQNNQLTRIEDGLFDKNVELKILYLDENKISAIMPTSFEKLNNIDHLSLKGNLCSDQDFRTNNIQTSFKCFGNYELELTADLDKYKTKTCAENLS